MRIFLIIMSTVFCFSGTAYAKWQIQFDSEADRVMHLGGDTLRGNFATKEQCLSYWRSRPGFEQNHSKCVGCDEQNSSQTRQKSRFIIGGPTNRTPEEEEMVGRARRTRNPRAALEKMKEERQQKQLDEQKEQQSQAKFTQDKKEMLLKLKGGSDGGDLSPKGSRRKLTLKSGNVSENIQNSPKNSELRKAEQRLAELREDVKAMQSALRLYQDGLMNNVSSLDQQSKEITKRSNDLLYDGAQYIFSVASDRFLKSKSNSKFMKDQKKKYDDFLKLIGKLKKIKDKGELLSSLTNSPTDTKILIDGAEMLAEDSLEKIVDDKLSLDDLPLWKHVKMNYKAWSSVGQVCVSWMKINDTNRGTEEYSRAVRAISLRMETAVEEINFLKQRMAESNVGCIQKCYR